MGANATSAEPAVIPEPLDRVEPRQTGGVTTRLILDYVQREGGPDAVRRLLRSRGLENREQDLRDEHNWCSYATKIAMLEAAAEVLDDPVAARHIGEAGMDFNVAPGLKLSLRALGSLRLLYKNIPRTCSKFTSTHRMEALEVGRGHAKIAYTDISGSGYHPADCELNQGFLSCAPILFGLPLARVSHPVCARDGGDTCVYELRWQSGASRLRNALGATAASAAAIAGALLFDPVLTPEAVVLAVGLGGAAARTELMFRRRRLVNLEQRARQQVEAADRLATSLQDLVSELKLEDVLAKIRKNAQVAVGGKEFALLVEDGDGAIRCRSSSTLPRESIAALERWAASGDAGRGGLPTLIDNLNEVPALAALPRDRALPLRSLCSAPLVFRGRSLGVLIALANAEGGFLPHDVELLQSYAAQAAIALENARLYEQQQQLASRDPLTSLLNHREFHEAVARELEECRRHGGAMAVVLLDLDDFKRVNDTSGHAAGDHLLLAAAGELTGACRASDQAFRIGGDEFALLLPRSSRRDAIPVAERAAQAMAGADGRVSVSYGIAEWPGDGPAKDTLLKHADERLYEMKRASRGSVQAVAAPGPGPADVAAGEARRRDRLTCANRLSARLASLLDPEQIVAATVDELHESFGYHLTVILRADADGIMRAVAGAGPLVSELDSIEALGVSLGEGIAGRVARTGEPALVHDTGRDPHYLSTEAPADSGSELAVAIRVGGHVWGVLNLEEVATDAFDEDDIVFADLIAAHVGAALDRTRLATELEGTFMTTLAALSDALEHKDAYTAAHAREVEDLTVRVCARLGLTGAELRTVQYAALLHDIGKIGIPSEILNKPDRLTDEEFEQIKKHTVIGARMLERIPFFEHVHPLVRSAHERWDGRGYPDALATSEIPLGARIICVCDAFHAMTSDRPYRSAMPVVEAIAEMRRCAGRQFDPAVVDALVAEAMLDLGRA
jgi:diguanylate cyclase (GGDEF)-like protein/putative nucleotidyltransferase with HDIG domain